MPSQCCGYFDTTTREYVITDPHTPVKWINYLGTLAMGGFVDHTGGALLCKGDPATNRITRYVQQDPAGAFKGTTLYLRYATPAGYRICSPFYVPMLHPLEHYTCRVGLGYNILETLCNGLRTTAVIFVPRSGEGELRRITVCNSGSTPRSIDAIPVVEYTHPQALMLFTNADWVPQTMQSEAVFLDDGHVLLTQFPFMHAGTRAAFFTADRAVDSFETDRKRFLGNNEYGGWHNPLSLREHHLSNYCARRGENIAALLIPLGTLEPGASVTFTTLLGQCGSTDEGCATASRLLAAGSPATAFGELRTYWNGYLASFQVTTPDPATNDMLNTWNQYQCAVTANWSRYLSYYQLGMGERGLGFRDTLQDVLGVLHAAPGTARSLIEKLLAIQRPNGSALHQMNPLTGKASTGECHHAAWEVDYYGDDHLWAILAVCAYLRETGDLAFCEKQIPWYHHPDTTGEAASVYAHLKAALAFTRGATGAHGLPLLGYADWNDTVNLPPGSESIFIACLYGAALKEMVQLCLVLGKTSDASCFRAWYDDMACAVNTHGWNGQWYNRYFDEKGTALGHPACTVGKIYVNAQSWAVISGFAPPHRARAALDAVHEHLATPFGVKIAAPGYPAFVPGTGGVSTYPPGAKENGGIFLHTNPWVSIALTQAGLADRAFDYYRAINPAARNSTIDRYEVEPYVYAQNILSNEHPQAGLGRNSWLSGTAAWAFTAATQHILGIQPGYTGLRIAPCIPPDWNGFTCSRVFRGCRYAITVRRDDTMSKGAKRLLMNGAAVAGEVAPLVPGLTECQIECLLGP